MCESLTTKTKSIDCPVCSKLKDGHHVTATGLDCCYGVLYTPDEADLILTECEKTFVYFEGDLSRVKVYGKWHQIPRKQCSYGDAGLKYTFSGVTVPAKPWPPFLEVIRDRLNKLIGCQFNFVLCNRYKDGSDYIGEHRDDEKDLVSDMPIASLSFGFTRDFLFRHQSTKHKMSDRQPGTDNIKLQLKSGQLLVMNPPTNRDEEGGKKSYRHLRQGEYEQLQNHLSYTHDLLTRIPQSEIEFKKEVIKTIIDKLKKTLGKHIFCIRNTGSAWERLQSGQASDFDVMFYYNIGACNWVVNGCEGVPGYCTVTKTDERGKPQSYYNVVNKNGTLSAVKVRKWFTCNIDRMLRKNSPLTVSMGKTKDDKLTGEEVQEYKVKITRTMRGPSTTLIISCLDSGYDSFTLDIVHAVHAKQLKLKTGETAFDLVAKPFDKGNPCNGEYEFAWRKSFSRKETRKLQAIDKDNKRHRKLLRIFKMVGSSQAQLMYLPSYFYKTLLLHLSNQPEIKDDWDEGHLAHRFVDLVIGLRNCLKMRCLPIYHDSSINLLHIDKKMSCKSLDCVADYLTRITNKGLEGYSELLNCLTMRPRPAYNQKLRDRRKRKRQKRSKKLAELRPVGLKKPSKPSKRK